MFTKREFRLTWQADRFACKHWNVPLGQKHVTVGVCVQSTYKIIIRSGSFLNIIIYKTRIHTYKLT